MTATCRFRKWRTLPRLSANRVSPSSNWSFLTKSTTFCCIGLGWRRTTQPAISSIGISECPEIKNTFISVCRKERGSRDSRNSGECNDTQTINYCRTLDSSGRLSLRGRQARQFPSSTALRPDNYLPRPFSERQECENRKQRCHAFGAECGAG